MKLNLLCLDDQLETLKTIFLAVFERQLKKGSIPGLKGGESPAFQIKGYGKEQIDVQIYSNRNRDPQLVLEEINNEFGEKTFDMVFVDDNWGQYGPVAGQQLLFPEVLKRIRGPHSELPIVVLFTQHWDQRERIQKFCELMDRHPDDILRVTGFSKSDTSSLMLLIQRVISEKSIAEGRDEAKREVAAAKGRLRVLGAESIVQQDSLLGIVGASPPMLQVYKTIVNFSRTPYPVLIRGESGTGKELLAQAIHLSSPRASETFRIVDCTQLKDEFLSSELFGHVKGAFTDASSERKGKIEEAMRGTLFLDEIGDLGPDIQARLLRFLQSHEFERLGSNRVVTADTRLVFATNRDLEEGLQDGSVREDFYFRINVFQIQLPPLRERKEDIPLLVHHFIKKCAKELNVPPVNISDLALQRLIDYSWPGNIRELENCIKYARVKCSGELIDVADIPTLMPENGHAFGTVKNAHPDARLEDKFPPHLRTKARYYLDLYEGACKKIEKPSGIKEHEIAKVLGRTRPTVSQKCREYGEAMLAFLNEFPQGWPNLQKRTNIREWCRNKG